MTVIVTYPDSNYVGAGSLSATTIARGQSFTSPSNATITDCTFYIRGTSSAETGDLTAVLYAESGDLPTGTALATSGTYARS